MVYTKKHPPLGVKRALQAVLPLFDGVLAMFLVPAALLLKAVRKAGVHRLPTCRAVLRSIGVFPIRDHYYEPLFRTQTLKRPWVDGRSLPGLDLNVDEQLRLLDSFHFASELADVPKQQTKTLEFHLENPSFGSGDAEYLYSIIRLKRPGRIFEIGSGFSTLMAIRAIQANQRQIPGYTCHHVCVEPYENPWLEETGVTVIRRRVEEIAHSYWRELQKDDLLFIDSSHVIRPQGDVLFEYLEVLPVLAPGVIVHVHDIFTPRDYPEQWIIDEVRFWNEQYLLEAFLTHNPGWKVVGALNYLRHAHFDRLREKCPFLTKEREPGSFYIQRSLCER